MKLKYIQIKSNTILSKKVSKYYIIDYDDDIKKTIKAILTDHPISIDKEKNKKYKKEWFENKKRPSYTPCLMLRLIYSKEVTDNYGRTYQLLEEEEV